MCFQDQRNTIMYDIRCMTKIDVICCHVITLHCHSKTNDYSVYNGVVKV